MSKQLATTIALRACEHTNCMVRVHRITNTDEYYVRIYTRPQPSLIFTPEEWTAYANGYAACAASR